MTISKVCRSKPKTKFREWKSPENACNMCKICTNLYFNQSFNSIEEWAPPTPLSRLRHYSGSLSVAVWRLGDQTNSSPLWLSQSVAGKAKQWGSTVVTSHIMSSTAGSHSLGDKPVSKPVSGVNRPSVPRTCTMANKAQHHWLHILAHQYRGLLGQQQRGPTAQPGHRQYQVTLITPGNGQPSGQCQTDGISYVMYAHHITQQAEMNDTP